MWDWSIVSKIWLCLLIAAILGGIIGWLLKTLFCKQKCDEYEARLRENEDELVRLRGSVSKVKGAADAENAKDDAEISVWKKKVSSLEADLRVCHDRQTTIEGELKDWSAKAATLSSAGAVVAGGGEDEDAGVLRTKLQAAESEKIQLLNRIKTLEASGSSEDADAKILRTKLQEAESEKLYLLGKIKKAEAGETIKIVPMDQRDDLELVNGIGPVLERMLYDLGIYFFKDIASWDAAKIAEIDEQLPGFHGRIEREGWVESAKEEHFKKYGERL